ncbi:hypothetical protein IAR50_004889 [Cryptococcus sp. DSM 104548]
MPVSLINASPTTLLPLPRDVVLIVLDFYIASLPSQILDLLYANRFCYERCAPRLYQHVTLNDRNSERLFDAYCGSLLQEGVSFVLDRGLPGKGGGLQTHPCTH